MAAVINVLLAAGVALTLAGVLPAAFRRDVLDRLHFATVAALAGIPLIAIAAMLAASNGPSRVKAAVVLLATVILNPLLTHALARAVYEGHERDRGARR
jgi:monovalent cation/proton antiporter MnhG/PhaG subunit